MYAFTLFLLPLAVPALAAWFPRVGQHPYRMAVRGGLSALPAILVWLALGFAYRPIWGSLIVMPIFLLRFFLIPCGLMAGAYALTSGLRDLERGIGYADLLSFNLGFMAIFNIAHAIALWGDRYYAYTLVLPVLLGATALGFPTLFEEAIRDGMPTGLRWLAAALGGLILASLALSLLFLRLEWLGLVLSAGFAAGSVFLGIKRLSRVR
ncbi:MAG: hypothetical protein E4H20_03065 [Spirochaetales bacterium]|nr:MAG: hypothetical protein E4H20_03065 [Spirochaetales bacterium]